MSAKHKKQNYFRKKKGCQLDLTENVLQDIFPPESAK